MLVQSSLSRTGQRRSNSQVVQKSQGLEALCEPCSLPCRAHLVTCQAPARLKLVCFVAPPKADKIASSQASELPKTSVSGGTGIRPDEMRGQPAHAGQIVSACGISSTDTQFCLHNWPEAVRLYRLWATAVHRLASCVLR